MGLVEQLAPTEQVVACAVEWCQSLLKLPQAAMRSTRARARADLAGLFNQNLDREIAEVVEMWWSPEVQAALCTFAERLGKKRE